MTKKEIERMKKIQKVLEEDWEMLLISEFRKLQDELEILEKKYCEEGLGLFRISKK